MKGMKNGIRTTSWVLTAGVLLAITAATAFVHGQMRDRIELIAANDNERILNSLLASLRDWDDFGSAIEADDSLSSRVAGVGVYLSDGESLYAWGGAPESVPVADVEAWNSGIDGMGRLVVPKPGEKILSFVVSSSRMGPPPGSPDRPAPESASPGDGDEAARAVPAARPSGEKPSFFFDTLGKGSWVRIDILHAGYWRSVAAMNVLFPLAWLALSLSTLYVRRLILRNIGYRERIEREKNLVVLGTAASTLAHEIKNPLLAIRLQTGIMRKTLPASAGAELDCIDREIERLSRMTYRINDYLREPAGNPVALDVVAFVREESLALLGRDAVMAESADGASFARVDPERFRSAFGNLLRNASESGGDAGEISIRAGRKGPFVEVEVLDRGKGIPLSDRSRLFEPFFTTKSSGTGIGLAISQRFAQAAGGDIRLEPRDGGGTVAVIRLPRADGGEDVR
jgi:two-component system, NtrC family, sensor histidine kinase HydH